MKQIFFLFLLLPFGGLAQTQADYENTMSRFVKYYNNKQGDSIMRMWQPDEEHDAWSKKAWSKEQIASMHKEYGRILSYKYLGIDTEDPNPGLVVFKTQFSVAGWKTTSFTLEEGMHLGTFRFITSSSGIDKLLKK